MGDTHFEGVKRTQQGHVVQRLKESKISDLALACTTCHETMIESVADRGFSRIQTMQVTSLHSGNNCSSNVVTAVLRDDLVNVAEIGDCIELVGTHARATLNPEGTFQSSVKGIAYSVVFTVNNARKIDWVSERFSHHLLSLVLMRFGKSPTDGYSCKLESKLRDTKIPASIEALLSGWEPLLDQLPHLILSTFTSQPVLVRVHSTVGGFLLRALLSCLHVA
ncbi:hypothetical protein BC830DRAFT_607536 [Chytriomyces sp. MP71]|nr:hypothetical protein BC830DRAFT_607536 [Chytriomyces sp. MP71]